MIHEAWKLLCSVPFCKVAAFLGLESENWGALFVTCSGERLSSSHTPKSALTLRVQTKLDLFHSDEYKFFIWI